MSPSIAVAELVAGCKDPIVIADRGPVRIIVINRPLVRNALTRQMRRDFGSYIAALDADATVAVAVLTGMDPAFSAGVDLKERAAGPPAPPVVPNPAEVLRAAHKPIIAAVNGACVTGALEMALSCSFLVASERACFADTHAKLGMLPRWGQTALLPRAIGVRRARQLMLTGEVINARTGLEWGLVNEVVSSEGLLNRCVAIGVAIAGADQECAHLQLQALREIDAIPLEVGLETERRALAQYAAARRMPP